MVPAVSFQGRRGGPPGPTDLIGALETRARPWGTQRSPAGLAWACPPSRLRPRRRERADERLLETKPSLVVKPEQKPPGHDAV